MVIFNIKLKKKNNQNKIFLKKKYIFDESSQELKSLKINKKILLTQHQNKKNRIIIYS